MMNGKEQPEMNAPEIPPKRVIAVDDMDDDDPPLYHDESGYQTYKSSPADDPKGPKRSKLVACITNATLEPFMFIYMFSYMLGTVCIKTLEMDKGCRHELNFSDAICSNLSGHEHEKVQVETIANNYGLYYNLIRFIPATFVVIFMGAWSDKYGRKPPLVLGAVGMILEDIGLVLNALYYEAPIDYFLLASIPAGLSGGFINVLSITYSLATESTSEKFRTIKFALVELGMALGMSLGILVGGIMSKYYSYVTIFATSTVGHSLATLWVLFLITETRGKDVTVGWKKKLCDVFTVERVLEGFTATLKKRPDSGRCRIWMLLLSICGVIISYIALGDIEFMYTYHRYEWDNAKYSSVSMGFSIVGITVSVVLIPVLIKFFKVKDTTLGLAGSISMIFKDVLIGSAAKPWLYYVGSLTGVFSGLAPLATRSYLSKMLKKDELGKIFAFIAACESLVPVAGVLLVTKVYNATISSAVPGATFYVAASILVPAIGTFVWLKLRKTQPMEELLVKGSIQN